MQTVLLLLVLLVVGFSKPPCSTYYEVPQPSASWLSRNQLMGVHVLTRHGDRTPESPFSTSGPVMPPAWNCDEVNQELGLSGISTASKKRYLPGPDTPLPGSCSIAQLTDTGFKQHRELGANLGKKFGGLVNSLSDFYVRSTNVERTIQSAQANMDGFFSVLNTQQEFDIWIFPGPDPLLPPALAQSCPATQGLPTWDNPQIHALEKEYESTFQEASKLFGIDPSLFPIILLHDAVICQFCHNDTFPLPNSVSYSFIQRLDTFFNRALNISYFIGTDLMIDPLVFELLGGDWLKTVQEKRTELEGPKYNLWSGHDGTLGFLLAGLDVLSYISDPPFASHVELELWRSKDEAHVYSIKIAYNGEYLTIPFCQNQTCPFLDWYQSLNVLTPTQWDSKCSKISVF